MKKLNERNQNQNSKIQTLISKSHNSPLTTHHSGITLIALVVTIVVLLILAGVTITLMFGENSIFDIAKEAGDKTNTAIEDEKTKVEGLDTYVKDKAGVTGGSSGGNPDVPQTPTLPDGWDSNKVTVVPGTENSENPVPLPNGFVKSGINGEQNVNTGLVIYQIPENEREGIDWTQKTDGTYLDVQKKYNQFVWVPIDDTSEMFGTDSNGKSLGKLYKFDATNGVTAKNWTETTGEKPVMSLTSGTSSREPDVVTGSSGTTGTQCDGASSNYTNANIKYKDTNTIITTADQFKEQLQEEFEAMRTSVATYGGFYIGRYETGNWHENEAKYGTTKAVVVRGCDDISATSSSDSKATWYAYYQKSKEVTNNANIKSSMIWGCQWDATLKWFISSGNKTIGQITSSGEWGNYGNSSNTKKATGSSDNYQANQIYDMAGNVYDWTIEAFSRNTRSVRGGRYDLPGSNNPASSLLNGIPTGSDIYNGSRLALYM